MQDVSSKPCKALRLPQSHPLAIFTCPHFQLHFLLPDSTCSLIWHTLKLPQQRLPVPLLVLTLRYRWHHSHELPYNCCTDQRTAGSTGLYLRTKCIQYKYSVLTISALLGEHFLPRMHCDLQYEPTVSNDTALTNTRIKEIFQM